MKTLIQILNEVSVSCGFQNFRDSTDRGKVYIVEHIIKEAGDLFLKQYNKNT
ncbi:hypothetical protein J2810_004612 [Chryseobacterium rhizosphaerae]|uniref:hypothetical protein n=1 Tax=Chryseobacterium rhizosphaerae TaxID=395937 RepID=UPI00285AB1B0|nr:hypothetical protein [Chryseobacterium rhizosphaerae]MDR6548522.1 hypothetical protein [Chryseobacterium rhizosphaerae]